MFKSGDDQMFSAIYSAYSRKLYSYGLKFTHNHEIIEDSIQDLFLELIKNRKTVGHTDNILRYLMKSFRFKLFRLLKYEKRFDLRNEGPEFEFQITFPIEQEIIFLEDAGQKTAAFQKALRDLTPRQKEAIYLKYTNELKYNDISEIMNMSLESCRNLIYRAVLALKEAVQSGKNS
jgi:RNA polymerase sigma factor (sigma-70 family)